MDMVAFIKFTTDKYDQYFMALTQLHIVVTALKKGCLAIVFERSSVINDASIENSC